MPFVPLEAQSAWREPRKPKRPAEATVSSSPRSALATAAAPPEPDNDATLFVSSAQAVPPLSSEGQQKASFDPQSEVNNCSRVCFDPSIEEEPQVSTDAKMIVETQAGLGLNIGQWLNKLKRCKLKPRRTQVETLLNIGSGFGLQKSNTVNFDHVHEDTGENYKWETSWDVHEDTGENYKWETSWDDRRGIIRTLVKNTSCDVRLYQSRVV